MIWGESSGFGVRLLFEGYRFDRLANSAEARLGLDERERVSHGASRARRKGRARAGGISWISSGDRNRRAI